MPPKSKYTKDRILEAAIKLVRLEGIGALSARALASALGCTTQPIFSCFESMEQLQAEVIGYAKALYADYIQKGLAFSLPFKGAGMQYIRYALEEPRFFQLLFMQDNAIEQSCYFPAGDENEPMVLAALQKTHHLSKERAKALYNHISIYTHGLAITFLGEKRIFGLEDAERMLSEVFMALLKEAQKND